MSTRCSIFYSKRIHYYRDQMDGWYYLELRFRNLNVRMRVWPIWPRFIWWGRS